MIQEEKRYKIKQKTSYEEQLNKEKKEIVGETFFLGLSVLGTFLWYVNNGMSESELQQTMLNLSGILSGGCGIAWIIELMKSISKKTMLQIKIDDLNLELDNSDDKKSKGMR